MVTCGKGELARKGETQSVPGMSMQQKPLCRAVSVPCHHDALGHGVLLSGFGAMKADEEQWAGIDGEGGLWCG